jgi:hypothetical protein
MSSTFRSPYFGGAHRYQRLKTLVGSAGADIISAGAGADHLYGNEGWDVSTAVTA